MTFVRGAYDTILCLLLHEMIISSKSFREAGRIVYKLKTLKGDAK
jgi:hypothetical protein